MRTEYRKRQKVYYTNKKGERIVKIMQQFISVKAYQEATPIQLVGHLISEIKAIRDDKELMRYLKFDSYQRRTRCGTYHCLAGYMASRSGILIETKHTKYLTEDFNRVFGRVDSCYYSKALCPSTDSDERTVVWRSIFGIMPYGGTLEDRLERAEKILENLKQKEK